MQKRDGSAIIFTLLLGFLMLGRPAVAINQPVTIDKLEDTQAGWTWSGMVEADDDAFSGGGAHAGGPGAYGMYTFTGTGVQIYGLRGPDVLVDGHHHKLGKLRISIDGHLKSEASLATDGREYNSSLGDVEGLKNGIHVLQVEPVGGWAAVDYIKVYAGATLENPADTTSAKAPADLNSGRVAVFDPLNDLDHVLSKSKGWGLDTTNSEFLGGDQSRANRVADTREYIGYACPDTSGFLIRIYTKMDYTSLTRVLQIYASPDSGTTDTPVHYAPVATFSGGGTGGWTGYDVAPDIALPAGTNSLYIVLNTGSGYGYDPEISQIAIKSSR